MISVVFALFGAACAANAQAIPGAAESSAALYEGAPITFYRVFITTLLNPKAIIFAFALLPSQIGFLNLLPWLLGLSVLIATAGTGWIILGCSLRYGFSGIVSGNQVTSSAQLRSYYRRE